MSLHEKGYFCMGVCVYVQVYIPPSYIPVSSKIIRAYHRVVQMSILGMFTSYRLSIHLCIELKDQ